MMNVTNPYWAPDLKFTSIKTKPKISGTLGFHFDIPWPLPTTAGQFFGEGAVPGRREMSYGTQGEYFATDNIVPSTGGVPMVNIYDKHYSYKRSDHVFKV
jgi:hypothetical protein